MTTKKLTINPELYDAVLFDMDGVVTRTAETHAVAWKQLFDEYLEHRVGSQLFQPFDIKRDYELYADGKPRLRGVQDFIASRGIDLPYGAEDDPPAVKSICGLGNRKNKIFHELLQKDGVQVYESTVGLIEQLRKNGFKTAIVSSSKNCRQVIQAVDVEQLFDTRVDGVVSIELGLAGKPNPDIFLEAAKRLNVDGRRCVVIEDALSGVEAGARGGFGMVVGVNRGDQAEQLREKGAHLVVNDLCEVGVDGLLDRLPGILQSYGRILGEAGGREIVLLLDHHSVLSTRTPPSKVSSCGRELVKVLSRLVGLFTVVIVGENDLTHLKNEIKIEEIYYASSSGMIIHGPEGLINNTTETSERSTRVELFLGILDSIHCVGPNMCPIYFGDNVKDRDIFELVGQLGITVAMGSGPYGSNATYRADSIGDILQFLSKISSNLDQGTSWGQIYSGFDAKDEGRREVLCALGNGYFVTRAAAPEAQADGIHYPGTYLAGGYNRLTTQVDSRDIENEDLVNIPNWLCLNFRIMGGEWFQLKDVKVLFYRQYLNIKRGLLHRTIRFRDNYNRETIILQQSFVHGNLMHRAALRTTLTPLNWQGKIEICSSLDGRVTNQGVKRYLELDNVHLDLLESKHVDEKSIALKVRTKTSGMDIAIGARTEVFLNGKKDVAKSVPVDKSGGYIAKQFTVNVSSGDALVIDKLVCFYTSRDTGVFECLSEAVNNTVDDTVTYGNLKKSHVVAWGLLWLKFDVRLELENKEIEQYTQKTIRLYIFHLLQSSSVHSLDIDVGMPARGWHGEGYRGHIFWDEMIIFPFLNFRIPRVTKTLLMYRYRRLGEAKRAARQLGYKGAMYPWQSGSNGREETQQMHLNPESGHWLPDNTYLQRHVNNAIVYNISQYFQITNDIEFLAFYGGEIIIEIARFWASLAGYNSECDRYEIKGVMGPDEYHDAYPGADQPGLNNNSYTNLMVMFVMDQALNLQNVIPEQDWESLKKTLVIKESEVELWKRMSRRMRIVFHEDGIISQFEGYESLKEFDWKKYRKKYGNIQRLDRILEREGDHANNYKLSKQPDVLMIFYLFSAETLRKMFKRLDYIVEKQFIQKNIAYYLQRTSNGSSLATTIHAWIEARQARKRSWGLFTQALETDMVDERTGSTREGIHLAAMSGCIDILQRGYAGLEIRSDILVLNPQLPKLIKRIRFHIRYRKHWLDLEITQNQVRVESLTSKAIPFTVMIRDEIIRLYPGKKAIVDMY